MPDTERYREWVSMLAASDRVLVILALIGLGAVFVWEVLRLTPEPWQTWLRRAYLTAALAYALTQIAGQVGVMLLGISALGVLAVARAVWQMRRG